MMINIGLLMRLMRMLLQQLLEGKKVLVPGQCRCQLDFVVVIKACIVVVVVYAEC